MPYIVFVLWLNTLFGKYPSASCGWISTPCLKYGRVDLKHFICKCRKD